VTYIRWSVWNQTVVVLMAQSLIEIIYFTYVYTSTTALYFGIKIFL